MALLMLDHPLLNIIDPLMTFESLKEDIDWYFEIHTNEEFLQDLIKVGYKVDKFQ